MCYKSIKQESVTAEILGATNPTRKHVYVDTDREKEKWMFTKMAGWK